MRAFPHAFLLLAGTAQALQISLPIRAHAQQPSPPTLQRLQRTSRLISLADGSPEEADGKDKEAAKLDVGEEDEALMASFRNRIEQEGGATNFKIRTDAQQAASNVKDGARDALSGISKAGSNLLDLGNKRPASDGLLDQDSWRLTVGFFAALIVLSIAGAVFSSPPGDSSQLSGGGVDMFTSDGKGLMFGSR